MLYIQLFFAFWTYFLLATVLHCRVFLCTKKRESDLEKHCFWSFPQGYDVYKKLFTHICAPKSPKWECCKLIYWHFHSISVSKKKLSDAFDESTKHHLPRFLSCLTMQERHQTGVTQCTFYVLRSQNWEKSEPISIILHREWKLLKLDQFSIS